MASREQRTGSRRPKIALALTAFFVQCSQAFALDLLGSYQLAMDNDPIFTAARYTLSAALEKRPQALAAMLPSISASGTYGQGDNSVKFGKAPSSERDIESYGWNIELTQPLFRLQSWAAYDQASYQGVQAFAEFDQAHQELILRVAQAYFDVLLADDSIRLAKAQVSAVALQAAQARKGYEVGIAPITDVYEVTSQLGIARADLIAAENERSIKRAQLERLIGPLAEELAELRSDIELPIPEPSSPVDWIESARHNYPPVVAREAALNASIAELHRNKAAHMPVLDVTASYGENYTSGNATILADTESLNQSAQVGLRLTVPLYAGGLAASRVREARENLGRAQSELEAVRREAEAMARQAYAGVQNGANQVVALSSAVSAGELSVKANTASYRVGVRDNVEVLSATQKLFLAQREAAKARYESLMQGLKLHAAVGILNDRVIMKTNQLLYSGMSQSSSILSGVRGQEADMTKDDRGHNYQPIAPSRRGVEVHLKMERGISSKH